MRRSDFASAVCFFRLSELQVKFLCENNMHVRAQSISHTCTKCLSALYKLKAGS